MPGFPHGKIPRFCRELLSAGKLSEADGAAALLPGKGTAFRTVPIRHALAGRERRLYADGLPDTFSDAGPSGGRFPLSGEPGKSVIFLFIRKISERQGISFLPGLLRGAAVWLFCFGCLYIDIYKKESIRNKDGRNSRRIGKKDREVRVFAGDGEVGGNFLPGPDAGSIPCSAAETKSGDIWLFRRGKGLPGS